MTSEIRQLVFPQFKPLIGGWMAIGSNTTLDVDPTLCMDSQNLFSMDLSSGQTIDATTNGLNGLDTGSLAASSVYRVCVIGSPAAAVETGVILTLDGDESAPQYPNGNYSIFRTIGYAITDASSHFYVIWMSNFSGAYRYYQFDTPPAVLTAGNATSFTTVDLSNWVPLASSRVVLQASFTPGAASRTANLRNKGSSTTTGQTVTGQVGSVLVNADLDIVLTSLDADSIAVDYKVSNSGDALTLNLLGFYAELGEP